jgi:hypothetical protein
LVIGAVIGAIAMATWLALRPKPAWATQIMLPSYEFTDSGGKIDATDFGFVHISGTITGDHIGYPNNTLTANCIQREMKCHVATIEQIGDNQMGTIDLADFDVVKWTTGEIKAQDTNPSEDTVSCNMTTLSVDRPGGKVAYVTQPINITRPICVKAENITYKRTIETSPGWAALNAASAKAR